MHEEMWLWNTRMLGFVKDLGDYLVHPFILWKRDWNPERWRNMLCLVAGGTRGKVEASWNPHPPGLSTVLGWPLPHFRLKKRNNWEQLSKYSLFLITRKYHWDSRSSKPGPGPKGCPNYKQEGFKEGLNRLTTLFNNKLLKGKVRIFGVFCLNS